MFTIESTPQVGDSKWVATESPVVFGLQRKDIIDGSPMPYITNTKDVGGFLCININALPTILANAGETVVLHDATTDTFMVGTVTDAQSDGDLVTDIPWVAGTDIDFANGNDNKAGYYFQAQLTINDTVNTLLIKASPNVNGYAEIDISPILQTVILPGKSGLETGVMVAENNKSGKFEVAFKECWYGSSESFVDEGNIWNYAEFVRSLSQGSNLEEYTPTLVNESPAGTFNYSNPICNLFTVPVITADMPFSISFLQGMAEIGSPVVDETFTFIFKQYSAAGILIASGTSTINVDASIMGKLCSINFSPAWIVSETSYCTFELTSKQVVYEPD